MRNIATYRRGSFPQPYGLSKWYDDVSGNPFIQVVDVTDEMKLKPETKKRLSAEAEKMSVFAKKGSVIISLNGSVGRVALTHYDGFIDRTLLLFESFLVPIDKYYFLYALSTVFREEEKKAPGAILKTITKEHLSNFLLPLPKIAEQEAIAAALSDADALIEALEQLLAKKRQVKQGAMQELLSGKRRLVESGKWEKLTLGKLAKIQRGASPRPIDSPIWFDEQSSVGWVRISDVTKSGMYLYETTQRLSPLGVENSRPIKCESLIMSICATVGRPIITKIDTCIHDGFVVFDNLAADKHFLYYVLKSIEGDWSKHGQTGSQMNLNTELINRTEVSIPSTLAEQTAIAEVLGEMDAEIAALEEKLSKARLVKQGMMQELLTGRMRWASSSNWPGSRKK